MNVTQITAARLRTSCSQYSNSRYSVEPKNNMEAITGH